MSNSDTHSKDSRQLHVSTYTQEWIPTVLEAKITDHPQKMSLLGPTNKEES